MNGEWDEMDGGIYKRDDGLYDMQYRGYPHLQGAVTYKEALDALRAVWDGKDCWYTEEGQETALIPREQLVR